MRPIFATSWAKISKANPLQFLKKSVVPSNSSEFSSCTSLCKPLMEAPTGTCYECPLSVYVLVHTFHRMGHLPAAWPPHIKPGEMKMALEHRERRGSLEECSACSNHSSGLGLRDKSWSPLLMKVPSGCRCFCFTSLWVQQPFPG